MKRPTELVGQSTARYDLKDLSAPVFSGRLLEYAAVAIDSWGVLQRYLVKDTGGELLAHRKLPQEMTPFPIKYPSEAQRTGEGVTEQDFNILTESSGKTQPSIDGGFRPTSVVDFHSAYRTGVVTPIQVAERVCACIVESNAGPLPLHAFIQSDRGDVMEQACQAAKRWAAGRPLSVLDGVPVAVKDEMDCVPYRTYVGTSFLGNDLPLPTADATVVARLRAAGAVIVGKTNMPEIGISVTGNQSHWGNPRNPYNPECHTGGSSAGSAAAVAAGLVPIAVGADGGGSIRIPAAHCGVVGLKPTFGRVSEVGAFPVCPSVGHIGPIAGCAIDCAIAYGIMAGRDKAFESGLAQPPVSLSGVTEAGRIAGLRIGVYAAYFEHADAESVSRCYEMLEFFKSLGATIVSVEIPDLEAIKVAHLVSILSEMKECLGPHLPQRWKDLSPTTRLPLSLTKAWGATEYVQAQRVRTCAMRTMAQLFENVDVIATPAVGAPAPLIHEAAATTGVSDAKQTGDIMRFSPLANFTGIPGISFPAGYTADGKPIGMQLMGRWWEEHLLLCCAVAAEGNVRRRRPKVLYSVLGEVSSARARL